jgi:transcriptional regulator with XRE-family HTH domain
LADQVKARRNALGLTQRGAAVKADVATQTWINVEQGEKVRERTLHRVDRALKWEPGSALAVLKGGDPTPVPGSTPPAMTATDQAFAELRDELEKLRDEVQELRDSQRS